MKLVERMPRVCKSAIKAKGSYFEKFYNVENSKNKEKPEWNELVSPNFRQVLYTVY
jgi:hypothetical protein